MSQLPVTIAAADLRRVLAAAKAYRHTPDAPSQLCVLTAAPVLTTHCRDRSRALIRRESPRYGVSPSHAQPMPQGDIARLHKRGNSATQGTRHVL